MKDSSLHFIIIDDDPINNLVCKAAIKAATGGNQVLSFNNPAESLKHFEEAYISTGQSYPVCVFLDLNMPEMNGWEWLEIYNRFPETVKKNFIIYILSSSVNPTDIDKANSNPLVKDYIIKPLTKAKVLDLLEQPIKLPAVELKIV